MIQNVLAFLFVCLVCPVYADIVVLNNGDRISGDITEANDEQIKVDALLLGPIVIDRHVVKEILPVDVISEVKEEAQEPIKPEPQTAEMVSPTEEKKSPWVNTIALAYTKTGGNTRTSAGSAQLKLYRKQEISEVLIKAETYYASEKKRMNAQKHFGEFRNDFRPSADSKWFNFYRVQADHDRFSNIDYRVTPALGRGYHFVETPKLNLLAEASLGYEYTNYRDATKSNGELVLIPRGYVDKTFWRDLKVWQDLTLYPSLEETERYRLKSETGVTQPLNENLSWKISFIDEFNSEPAGESKKNDYRLISGIDYKF